MSTRSRLVTSAVAAGVVAFAAAGVMAQQVNPKLVITGKEAEDIGEFNMINAATAEAISHSCEKMAADHGQNAAIVITDTFGNVVHEHRIGWRRALHGHFHCGTEGEDRTPYAPGEQPAPVQCPT